VLTGRDFFSFCSAAGCVYLLADLRMPSVMTPTRLLVHGRQKDDEHHEQDVDERHSGSAPI
jgi:hypothetical protein